MCWSCHECLCIRTDLQLKVDYHPWTLQCQMDVSHIIIIIIIVPNHIPPHSNCVYTLCNVEWKVCPVFTYEKETIFMQLLLSKVGVYSLSVTKT